MTIDEAINKNIKMAELQERLLSNANDSLKEIAMKFAAEYRQLAEWLTELKEAKRLLKAAVEGMYNSVNDVHCKYCSKWHTDQCQETSHLDCYIENKFKWRHEDEALALIGEGTNVPASADDTNVGQKSGDWISVNDRLPEAVEEDVNGKIAFSELVLVYLVYNNGFTYITTDQCRVDDKSWLHEIPGEGCKVTHWQPLPEPPKDGDT